MATRQNKSKLAKSDIDTVKKVQKLVLKTEDKIEKRITYIAAYFAKKTNRSFSYWYYTGDRSSFNFDGNFDEIYIEHNHKKTKNIIDVEIEGKDFYFEISRLSFPIRWLYEDFESEVDSAFDKAIAELDKEQENKAEEENKKKAALKKLSASERKLLGV